MRDAREIAPFLEWQRRAEISPKENRAYLVKSVLVNHSIDVEEIDGCCHDPLTFWKYHQARLNMGMIDIVTNNFQDAIEKKSDWWLNFEDWILNLGKNFKSGDHILAISAFVGGLGVALSPILIAKGVGGGIMATIIGCLGGSATVVAGGGFLIALILYLIVRYSNDVRSVTAHLNPLNWVLGVLIIIKFLIDNSLKIVAKTFDKLRFKKLGTLVRYISKLIGGVARLLGFVPAIISAPIKSARSLKRSLRRGGGRTIRRKKMKGNKRTKKKHIRRSMNIQKTRRRRR